MYEAIILSASRAIFSLSSDQHLFGWGKKGSGWKQPQGTHYNGICKIQMVSDSNQLENVTDPKKKKKNRYKNM